MQQHGSVHRHLGCLILVLGLSAPSAAQTDYSYPYAYVHAVDGTLTVQRASNPEPEDALVNSPVLPGDRLWTHEGTYAEVRYADGTILRLGGGAKVDFSDFDSSQSIQLWSGSLILRVGSTRLPVRVDTVTGSVQTSTEGLYRVDVDDAGKMTLSVFLGEAELASFEGSVLVRGGERSTLESSRAPEPSFAFDAAASDAFDRWSSERDGYRPAIRRDVPLRDDLPAEVHHYTDTLSEYGEWRTEDPYGSVWYPTVATSWAPYRDGYWSNTSYGYTWVSYEPWGWAPYHYGRWGYGAYGWYWIPGRHWGPAWVSVAVGPTWIGWSPLGYYNRPVFVFNHAFYGHGKYGKRRYRGRAVPRHVYDYDAGWSFKRSNHFGRRQRARVRAQDVRHSVDRARFYPTGSALRRDAIQPRGRSARQREGGFEARPRTRPTSSVTTSSFVRARPRGSVSTTGSSARANRRQTFDRPQSRPTLTQVPRATRRRPSNNAVGTHSPAGARSGSRSRATLRFAERQNRPAANRQQGVRSRREAPSRSRATTRSSPRVQRSTPTRSRPQMRSNGTRSAPSRNRSVGRSGPSRSRGAVRSSGRPSSSRGAVRSSGRPSGGRATGASRSRSSGRGARSSGRVRR